MPKLRTEQLESRTVPSWLVAAGGLVVDTDTGHSFRPFVSSFLGPVKLAAHEKELFVGAGVGGGPRYQIRDVVTGAVKVDAFVPGADPASRSGVDGVWVDGAIPNGPSLLRAEAAPGLPASASAVAEAQAIIDTVPSRATAFMAAHGGRVLVYGGRAITDLPQFANLRGVLTGAAGDGDRTYDQVPAVGGAGGAVVPAGVDAFTLHHEMGHVLESEITDAQHAAWVALFPSIKWATDYERLNETEAFAESSRRWDDGIIQPDGRINPFMDSLFVG